MNLFTKNTFRNFALSMLGAAVLSACGGAGSCTNCSTPTPTPTSTPGTLSLSIEAPSQYPAGLPVSIDASLTMTNTSSVDASNLVYTIPAPNAPGNYTKVVITPNAGVGSASGDCTNIAAGASCTFVATISAYASPGSFTVTATPNSTAAAKTTQSSKSFQADSISVTANLGLVDIPNTNNEYYILPSDQTIQGSATQATTAYVSVLVKKVSSGLSSFKLVNELGEELTYTAIGTPKYTVNSVNSYKVTVPAGQTVQHVQALSNVCTTLNNGTNNDTACSNDADINLAQSGVGILAIQPNYFQMTESVTSQVITLQNIGTGNITDLQLPTIAAPFKIISNGCADVTTLTPLSSCLITIGYTVGSTSGQGSYVVNYNNGSGTANTTATIPYIGTSTAPYAIVTASPTSFSLSTSNTRQRITLTNTGTTTATSLTLPTVTAPLTKDVATTTCTSSLAVGVSCFYDVYIDYTQDVTTGSSTLAFAYNNGQAAQTINVAADWSAYTVPMANLTLSSSTMSLNTSGGFYQTITVTNSGNASATNLVLPAISSPLYLYSLNTCIAGQTLAAGKSCSYSVAYAGGNAGSTTKQFIYTGGGSPVNLTINWQAAQQYYYIAADSSTVYKCILDSNDNISYCLSQGTGINDSVRSLAFTNAPDGINYLYITQSSDGVAKCTVDGNGDINTCDINSGAALDNAADFGEASYIVFGIVNNVKYAYVADYYNHNVYTCTLKTNGDFDTCALFDASDVAGITFNNINGTPYLYMAGDDGNSHEGIVRFALNPANGQLIADSAVTAGDATYKNGGINIFAFNGVNYAYSGNDYSGGISCALDANGIYGTSCNTFNGYDSGGLPYNTTVILTQHNNTYAYFGGYNGVNGLYRCTINTGNGALNCSLNSALSAYSITSGTFTATPPITFTKHIFVTNGTWNGDLKTAGAGASGYAGANALCQAAADTGTVTNPLAATWKALLWGAPSTTLNEGYLDTVGNFIAFATNADGYLVGYTNTVFTPIMHDENGTQITSGFDVWTGANRQYPLPSYTNCNSWISSSGGDTGFVGLADSARYWALDGMSGPSRGCDALKRLYCVQQ